MRIAQAPVGVPVQCWAVTGPGAPTISGFSTPEAARAWATEWACDPRSIISPVCQVGDATRLLARAEYRRAKEEGEEGALF
jgi:hypothetical protein